MGAYLPNRANWGETMEHFSWGVLMNFVEWHASLIPFSYTPCTYVSLTFTSSCWQQCLNLTRRRGSVKVTSQLARFGFFPLKCSFLFPNISLQQSPFLNPFPITPREVTQNYLRSIPYLPEQTKARECFQSQRGEASRVDWDVSWHLPFPSPCHTTKGAEGRDTKPESAILNQWQITWECITTLLPKHDQKPQALNLFGFCVQIGQLSCKACVCVSGTLSVMKKGTF